MVGNQQAAELGLDGEGQEWHVEFLQAFQVLQKRLGGFLLVRFIRNSLCFGPVCVLLAGSPRKSGLDILLKLVLSLLLKLVLSLLFSGKGLASLSSSGWRGQCLLDLRCFGFAGRFGGHCFIAVILLVGGLES